ncbi:hypothetical protein HDV00_008492 [Rhizophlyctis rosea]|nr:hypothetical protein HDV00_008492 [Rhizophlyctis rosea]
MKNGTRQTLGRKMQIWAIQGRAEPTIAMEKLSLTELKIFGFMLKVGHLISLSNTKGRHDSSDVSSPITTPTGPTPPTAKKIRTVITIQGTDIIDDYAWLRNLDTDPDVKAYIDAENNYTDQIMRATLPLQKQIKQELADWNARLRRRSTTSHITNRQTPSDPDSITCEMPDERMANFWEFGSFVYWIEYPDGGTNPIYKRRQRASPQNGSEDSCSCMFVPGSAEQVVMDFTLVVPSNASYFLVGAFEVSPYDEDLLAYSIDRIGSELYTINFHNISSSSPIPSAKPIQSTYYSVRWAVDILATGVRHWVYYNTVDDKWDIPFHIGRQCVVGCTDTTGDGRVLTGTDPTVTANLESTNDGGYLFATMLGQITSSYYLLSTPNGTLTIPHLIFAPTIGVKHTLEHRNGIFYILTNAAGAYNYQILQIPVTSALAVPSSVTIEDVVRDLPGWNATVVLAHDEMRYLERMEVFVNHMVVWYRTDGLRHVLIIDLTLPTLIPTPINSGDVMDPSQQVHTLLPSTTEYIDDGRLYRRWETGCLVFSNSSYVDAGGVWGVDLGSGEVVEFLRGGGGWSGVGEGYRQRRVWVEGGGGVKVPVSVVWKDLEGGEGGGGDDDNNDDGNETTPPTIPSEPRPLLLLAYGAYGGTIETRFTPSYFPLLDRGVVIAQCHPRGDADLGGRWYTDGKFEKKENTFADVRTCIEGLVEGGWTERGRVGVKVRSAGGLIGGVVVNRLGWEEGEEGEGYVKVVVAEVPFVDPVLDMSDESVPWTAFEWYEWGNPLTNTTILSAMLSYSPYYNIKNQSFPSVMVTGGLADPRVPYWEPTKYVAKLRAHQTNPRVADGISGAPVVLRISGAGHFESEDGMTEWYAFLLGELGVV